MLDKIMEVERVGIIAPPVAVTPLTPEQAAKGSSTTTMIFDKPALLTVNHGTKIQFPAGVNEVPNEHADHWYLKAHNVRPYARPVAAGLPTPPVAAAPTGIDSLSREELLALAKGYGLKIHPATKTDKLIEKINAAKSNTVPSTDPEPDGNEDDDPGEADPK